MYASQPRFTTAATCEERRANTPKRLLVMNMKRRMEVFGAAAYAHDDDDDSDDDDETYNSSSSFIMMATSELFASSSSSVSPSSPSSSSSSSDKSRSRRNVLFGIAAQLALVCTLMCAFEGVFRPMALHALVVNETTGVLQRAVRSIPVFIGLLYLLDKSKSSFLWSMQLFVAARIHMSALGLQNEKEPERSRAIANVLLALMLLAYPLHRFFRHSLVSKAWVVPLAAVSLAESAVLASVDSKLMPSPHVLLLNCAFFACSTFVMGLLSCECVRAMVPASSSSTKAGVLAYGVVAMAAMMFRDSVQLSPNAFTISLVAQLALALLVSREMAPSSLPVVEAAAVVEEVEEEVEVEKPCMSASEYLFIKLFVVVATSAVALLLLGLAGTGVRYLFG